MANKIKFGLKNVHYAPYSVSEAGVVTFETPIRIFGGVSLTMEPVGETFETYADDTQYFTKAINNGYDGSLELVNLPDDFKTTCLGEVADAQKGFYEVANAVAKPFALMFEVNGDANKTQFIYYNCLTGRIGQNSKTTTSTIEANNDTLSIQCRPIELGDLTLVRYRSTTHSSTFYDSVYIPSVV